MFGLAVEFTLDLVFDVALLSKDNSDLGLQMGLLDFQRNLGEY